MTEQRKPQTIGQTPELVMSVKYLKTQKLKKFVCDK